MSSTSMFTYNTAREYPFRWFTPVVFVGGIVLTVLFSFLNLASTGYRLTAELTNDPNSTTAAGFYDQLPSFVSGKLSAFCEPAVIPVNSNLITNNSALTYTLTSVVGQNKQLYSTLTYHNNLLQDCVITSTTAFLERAYARTAAQISTRAWGINLAAMVTCKVQLDSPGLTTINLTASWDPLPSTLGMDELQWFLGRDKTSQASLYWGESLLVLNWLKATESMEQRSMSDEVDPANILKAQATLHRSGLTTDIQDLSYYNASYRGILFKTNGVWAGPTMTYTTGDDAPLVKSHESHFWPDNWLNLDRLAKSFEWTILTDLGQVSASPNILTDPKLLQFFTSNFSMDWNATTLAPLTPARLKDAAHADYESLRADTGSLLVRPATFANTYICNVPIRKSMGDLVIAILVADLVLLQAAWKLYCFFVGLYVRKKDEYADWCVGCLPKQLHISVDGKAYKAISPSPERL